MDYRDDRIRMDPVMTVGVGFVERAISNFSSPQGEAVTLVLELTKNASYWLAMLQNTFHEYTVLKFDYRNNRVVLELLREPDEALKVRLVFSEVEEVLVDGETPSERIGFIYPDGFILSVVEDTNSVLILVEWTDFKTRNSVTKSYEFKYRSLAIDSWLVGALFAPNTSACQC